MSSEYIGFNVDADYSPDQATVGTSTGSTDVELRIDLTKVTSRMQALLIIEAITRYIEDGRTSFMGG